MMIRLLFLLSFFCTSIASANDAGLILQVAEQHLRQQTQGQSATITMGQLDSSRLPACTAMEAFTPQGGKLIGKIHVGVRCLAPNSWSILVPAQIAVNGNYLVTSRALLAGQVIQAGDVQLQSGDLARLPTGTINEVSRAIGKTLRNSLGAGQVVRNDQLLAPLAIQQGQTVKVIYRGSGFSASSDGVAMNNAAAGQVVRARMPSGQTISGIATEDGNIEISN